MASSHQKGNDQSMFISNSPHFFKIILQDTVRNGELGIPRKFVRKYGNGMSNPAFLRVPTGAVWKVELTKSDGEIWLKNGWQEFSNHYSLEFGHFLVFRYEGNSNFHVVIFDKSTSEIEYPYTSNNNGLYKEPPLQNTEESEDDDSIQILENISPSRKMKRKSQLPCPQPHKMMKSTNSAIRTESNLKSKFLAPQSSTSHHRIQQLKADTKVKALQRASSTLKSENPVFLVVMQPSYVCLGKRCGVGIPTKFVRKHLMKEHYRVSLCNTNGESWTVGFNHSGHGKRQYARLRTGWEAFVRDNNIQVGDVCAFELINCIELSFKVVIYKGQNAHCHQSFTPADVHCPAKKNAGATYGRQGCPESLNAHKKAKAYQIASAFRSANPYFVVVLRPSYVHTHKLSVPENFARKHFTRMHREVILFLSNGKSWPVKYYQLSIKRPSAKLHAGWRRFVQDNNLDVGDVCLFELTECTETSFKVTIYKKQAVENANFSSSLSDKSRENEVELQESLVIKAESDWMNEKGDMFSLQNQHPCEEYPVPKIKENQRTQEEKPASQSKVLEEASPSYQTLQEIEAFQASVTE